MTDIKKQAIEEKMKDLYLDSTTILYVEDEEIIRTNVARFLKRRIKELYLATNGKEGIDLFRLKNPDIVVTDIRMPVMNGLDMAGEIKAINDDCPVIITTAYNDEEYFLKAIDIGVDKYIKKPINNKELLHVLLKTARIVIQQRDIDAKNEFIRTILDNNPTFIMITDGENITFLNKSFLNYLGFATIEEFQYKCKTLNRFLVLKEESFYKGKSFQEWLGIIVSGNSKDYIVHLSGKGELKSEARAYLLHASEIPGHNKGGRYLVSFTDVSHIEMDRKKYQNLACKDPLTSIYNRKKFEDELTKEIERVVRYKSNLAIIIFDIDHFKHINDNYGHQVGDYVLQELTALVDVHIRATDIFARYGGEEFIILTPETTIEGARELAEKLRETIDGYAFNHVGHVTCSFGVSEYVKEESAYIFIKKADYALYIAKNKGRNRVSIIEKEHSLVFNV
ncbi:MAG: diguanylate cyclase [Nitrospirae bacterium]|uniref:GGDEF domain-containing response regulator n=1 Tax=Candidatus Magnetobacterium casense TaxID=1455061 RepID=UPI000697E6A3|nr:diguanylate cyclase [Candidatus Magnetobacterium casensis]MBF0338336.1 diguanylate cyclase [Nitrospirota bacterium]